MPRKTIAALEARIVELEAEVEGLRGTVDIQRADLDLRQRDPNTYLSYVPSGDQEMDALQVAVRAIGTLSDPATRSRCVGYLSRRFPPPILETASMAEPPDWITSDQARVVPFTKITSGTNRGKFRSPSGRIWTAAQIRAYEARKHGAPKPTKKKG